MVYRMAVMAATDWLIQNENDPDIDTPLPELEDQTPAANSQETAVSWTSPFAGRGVLGGGGRKEGGEGYVCGSCCSSLALWLLLLLLIFGSVALALAAHL